MIILRNQNQSPIIIIGVTYNIQRIQSSYGLYAIPIVDYYAFVIYTSLSNNVIYMFFFFPE